MVWLLKLTSPLVLVVRRGRVELAKGHLSAATLRELQGLLTDWGVAAGTLHADGRGRFHFSAGIPVEAHQRLRNVLTLG